MKKVAMLLGSFSAIGIVSAAFPPPAFVDGLSKIFPRVATYTDPASASFILFMKFLLFILSFAVLYFGITRVDAFKDAKLKKIVVVMSVILGLMTTVLIPDAVVLSIYQSYSWIFGTLAFLAPALIGIALMYGGSIDFFKKDTRASVFVKGVLLALIGYIYGSVGTSFLGLPSGDTNVASYVLLGAFLAMLGGVLFIFKFLFWNEEEGPSRRDEEKEPKPDDEEEKEYEDKYAAFLIPKLIDVYERKKEIWEITETFVTLFRTITNDLALANKDAKRAELAAAITKYNKIKKKVTDAESKAVTVLNQRQKFVDAVKRKGKPVADARTTFDDLKKAYANDSRSIKTRTTEFPKWAVKFSTMHSKTTQTEIDTIKADLLKDTTEFINNQLVQAKNNLDDLNTLNAKIEMMFD